MSLTDKWINLVYRVATGDWRTRLIIAPLAAACFLSVIIVLIFLSFYVDKLIHLPGVFWYPWSLAAGISLIVLGFFLSFISIACFIKAIGTAFSYGKRTVVSIGPTEGAIVADDSADPSTIVYDMISESEHGPDSSFMLATPSESLAHRVREQLGVVIQDVQEPRKTNILSVFGDKGFGAIVVTGDIKGACEVINEYAPEHLMIWCNPENEKVALEETRNTGEILVGPFTTFSTANYMIGITAVLPTNGFAKRFSGVTCKDMVKFSSFGKLDKKAIEDMFPAIKAIGEYEGLPCHVKAAEVRIKQAP